MSRQLPEKPNFEFLKKQAKELVRALPHGKLADAQHTLANEYGFATWAELKVHVQALELTPAQALKAAVDQPGSVACLTHQRGILLLTLGGLDSPHPAAGEHQQGDGDGQYEP